MFKFNTRHFHPIVILDGPHHVDRTCTPACVIKIATSGVIAPDMVDVLGYKTNVALECITNVFVILDGPARRVQVSPPTHLA